MSEKTYQFCVKSPSGDYVDGVFKSRADFGNSDEYIKLKALLGGVFVPALPAEEVVLISLSFIG